MQPSSIDNYQIRTVYQRGWLSADVDLHDLRYHNNIASAVIGADTLHINLGNAILEGVEPEATAQARKGVTLYADGR